jgi:HSP20 family molecular chaperone IbpA
MCHEDPKKYKFMFDFHPKDIAGFGKMAGHFMKQFMTGCGYPIPYNIEDLGDNYLITIPLPGRTKDQVKVSLIDKILKITAAKPEIPKKKGEEEKPKERPSHPHPWFGFRFVEVDLDIPLPPDADENLIDSKIANGLLSITIKKKPAKHIDITEIGNN